MEIPPPIPDPAPNIPPVSEGPTDTQWALYLHLSSFLVFVLPTLGNIIAPLIFWLLKKESVPSLDQVGKDVLNFQISWTIYLILTASSMLFCIGYLLFPIAFVAWVIFMVMGTIKASNGERYIFPLTIKFLA